MDGQGGPSGVTAPDAATLIGYAAGDPTLREALLRRTPTAGTAQDLSFAYLGPLVSGSTFAGPAAGSYSYSYDAAFRLTGMNLAIGATSVPFAIAYDADGLPTTLGPFSLTRNGPGGAPTSIGDGTGQFSLGFDSAGRLATRSAQVNAAPVYQEQLTYDAAGRITQRVETVGSTPTTFVYGHDANSQLTSVSRNSVTVEQYGYDSRGNRTSRQLGTATPEAAVYDLQDRLQSRGGVAYGFDANGFLSTRGSDSFQFGTRGELLSATVGSQTVSYGYDGFGRRTSRTDTAGTYRYLYANPKNDLQLTAAVDPSGVVSAYIYEDGGRLIAIQRGPARYYVATNLVGSPVAVADATGAIVKQLEWDAFGNVVADSNPGFDLPVGFAGGLRDPLTGFTRFGLRDYEPASGRWVSRDPALFEGRQANLYAYVSNDPVNMVDFGGAMSGGASAYDGIGGGIKFSFTDQGMSFCAEIGFGLGDSFEFNPTGDLDDDGVSLDGSLAGKLGPFGGLESGFSIKECANIEKKVKACAGPFCAETPWKGTTPQETKGKIEAGTDINKLNPEFKVEGKIAANFCAQSRW